MDFYTKNINTYLNSLDQVLNSNSFLLKTSLPFGDIFNLKKEIIAFIKSGAFKNQLLQQDIARGWNNFQRSQKTQGQLGLLIKDNFELRLKKFSNKEGLDYLIGMLTCEQDNPIFGSPYNKQLNYDKAEKLATDFLLSITDGQRWKFYSINTDFSYTKNDRYKNQAKKLMTYFCGLSDSVSIVLRKDKEAYFLLTNGSD